jgi:diguanylate cyclase (GGDEF)-like protein
MKQLSALLGALSFALFPLLTLAQPTFSTKSGDTPVPPLPVIAKPLDFYTLKIWNANDGLPHNSVNRITQDHEGYLWLATWEGPVRFNGREFVVYDDLSALGASENGVFDISSDGSGKTVIASGRRGLMLRHSERTWQVLASADDFVHETVVLADGTLWAAASNAGVLRIDATGASRYYTAQDGLPDTYSQRIFTTGNDAALPRAFHHELWVGTEQGLAVYDATTDRFETITELPAELVRAVLRMQSGHLAVGMASGLYFCSPELTRCGLYQAFAEGRVSSLLEGIDNELWVGTFAHGVARITASGVDYFGVEQGLPNLHVLDLFLDQEQNLWLGTHGGLVQMRNALFTSYTRRHGANGEFVRAIEQTTDGAVWVGSSEGLTRIFKQQAQSIAQPPQLENLSILSLTPLADKGLLVGSHTDGIFLLQDGEIKHELGVQQGLSLGEVRSILPLNSHHIWLGTANGVLALELTADGFTQQFRLNRDDGLASDFVVGLYRDQRGTIWASSIAGLTRIQQQPNDDLQITAIDLESIGSARNVFAMTEHQQRLWFATDRGLLIYQPQTDQWRQLERRHGLPFHSYFSIVFDRDGHLWLGSSRGILRIDHSSLMQVLNDDSAALEVQLFDSSDGLHNHQTNVGGPSAILAEDGRLWFSTAGGPVVVDPASLQQQDLAAPPIVLEQVRINDTAIDLSQDWNGAIDRIRFNYTGLGFRMTQQLEYRVQLRGFDQQWVERQQQTQAEYTSLPAGDFEFAAQVRYPGSPWSEPVTYRFTVPDRFYETFGFWLLIAVLGVLTTVGLFRWRLYALQQSRNTLKQLVKEQTKELQLLAHQDDLTRLPNRRAFDQQLRRRFAQAQQQQQPLCLAVIDVDHFKRINDNYLHATGDRILQRIAQLISRTVRQGDFAARWGGEEFTVLLPNTHLAEAKEVCERIRQAIEAQDYSDLTIAEPVTVSIGIACNTQGDNAGKLLAAADKALYAAKKGGRNCIRTEA